MWERTFFITSAAAIPGYGVEPSVTISHIKMPKLQMSDLTVNILSYKDSGAIHLELRGRERRFNYCKSTLISMQWRRTPARIVPVKENPGSMMEYVTEFETQSNDEDKEVDVAVI